MTKRYGPALIAANLFVLSFPAFAYESAVRLVSSETKSATLELILPSYRFQNGSDSTGLSSEIKIAGWAQIRSPGDPKLPLTGALLEVPRDGNHRMSIVSAEFETIFGYEAPAGEISECGESSASMTPREAGKSQVYLRNSFFPGELARICDLSVLRGVPVARVIFYPFQWNPVTRELRIYKKLRVRVDFDGILPPESPGSGANDDEFSALARSLIVNYSARDRGISPLPAKSPTAGLPWKNALRLEISENGVYRVGYAEMAGAGVPLNSISPAAMKLYNRGREVALSVVSKSETAWEEGDYVEFYGRKIISDYADTNIYWLTWEAGPGIRMQSRRVPFSAAQAPATEFREELLLEENTAAWGMTPGAPASDYWFWARLTAPASLSVPFHLPDDARTDSRPAQIQVCFQGRSAAAPHPNHKTVVSLNQSVLGEARWDSIQVFTQNVEVPQSLLNKGSNDIRIDVPGTGIVDVVYLNWIKILYWRGLNALRDEIHFSVEGAAAKSFEIGGFSGADISVLDISDPDHPVALEDFTVAGSPESYKVRFDDQTPGARRYYAFASRRSRCVQKIETCISGGLTDNRNRADVIIIAPRDFRSAALPLMMAHLVRRVRPYFAAAEDIFNEFGDGFPDPAAIKAFLQYAYENWERPAPLYVLLAGDSTYDFKDHLKSGKAGRIPFFFSWTQVSGLTPDDNRFVCVDGDDALPDMFIGRIPGESAEAMSKTLAKIAKNARPIASYPHRVLLVADNNEIQFEDINERLVPLLPPDCAVDRVYLRNYADPGLATQDLIASVNQGVFLVNYVGHGSVTNWAGELIFENAKVDQLSNRDHLALFCTFTCSNGFFADPYGYCLAETLIAAQDKGAFACIAPSAASYPSEHELLSSATMTTLFQFPPGSMGAVIARSKIAAFARGGSEDILKMFTLFGDPAARAEIR